MTEIQDYGVSHPLSVQEQIIPIVGLDYNILSNAHDFTAFCYGYKNHKMF